MRTFLAVFFVSCVINQYIAARRGRDNSPPLPVAFDEDDVISIVNKAPVKAWKAERTKFYNKRQKLRQLLGTTDLTDDEFDRAPKVNASTRWLHRAAIPAQFDARTQWPTCVSIRQIRDQGGCGSCWAVSVASALTDRICIKSSTKYTYAHISTQDLMTCCKRCGGCNGGIVEYAYEYFTANGSVTGSEYNAIKVKQTGCRPYTIPIDYPDWTITPACTETCQNSYHRQYALDKYQGTGWAAISKLDGYGGVTEDTETNIKLEIMTNGPVSCSMKVYEDFGTYTSGVYQHVTGAFLGGHAVKCIGWGVDEVTKMPYWLAANSWGPDWGEKGFFRILRGRNECNIEGRVNAGYPKQYG